MILAEEFRAPNLWKEPSLNTTSRESLITLLRSDQHLFPLNTTFCMNLKHPNRILPWKRIGSPSSEAEVYQIKSPYHNVDAALKIMPILTSEDEEKNKREIDTAIQASNLVVSGQSHYFPLVYGWGHCFDMTLFQNSKFEERAKYHSQIALRARDFPSKRKMLERFEKISMSLADIDTRLNIPKYVEEPKVEGDFLISELAHMDLSRWASEIHLESAWRDVLNGILLGLQDLRNLGICHNDMHLGNVLIKYENGLIPLIHDFGKVEPLNGTNVTQDLIRILDSLVGRERVRLPVRYTNLLSEALDDLGHITQRQEVEELTDNLLRKL